LEFGKNKQKKANFIAKFILLDYNDDEK